MKIAIAQMSSTSVLEANLQKMRQFAEEAAKGGAQFVAFPEMAYLMGKPAECHPLVARYDEIVGGFSRMAKEFGISLLPGSLREPVPGQPDKFYNTAVVIDPSGKVQTKYRKLFLFEAKLPDRHYFEAEYCVPGNEVVSTSVLDATLGLSICFDLRFPELYGALKKKGAQIACVPSAFTVPSGMAHWENLLRARAIENQFFVIAPAQVGLVGDHKVTYGHSLVVSPWGDVLADLGMREGVAICDLRLDSIRETENKIVMTASRTLSGHPFGNNVV